MGLFLKPKIVLFFVAPLVVAAAVLWVRCSSIAVWSAPPKRPAASTSRLAHHAVQRFWASFSEARYEDLPEIRRLLTAAYLETPTDPQLALLLAHAHLWTISERARLRELEPGITDHLILAERYFEEAGRLAPNDERMAGWLGPVKMALGEVHRDERLKREGYVMVRAGADAYLEFNGFSLAYPLIRQPHDSPRFQEAVEAMWRSTEACTGRRYDRERPPVSWAELAPLRTGRGRARVCWNTALVPHNVEGFFLHFGDLLLKNGQREAAEAAYRLIKQTDGYSSWRFKSALEERLGKLDDWSRRLRDGDPGNDPPYLFASPIACVGCHAR